MKFKFKKRSKKSLDINYMPLHVIYIITAENLKKICLFGNNGNFAHFWKTGSNFWAEKDNAISEIAKC